MRLQLSDDLSLPLDAITQTFGILAVRGAGKSNLAAVMAEEMFEAKLPFVVVDPVGAWWGLRSELAVPIFGGRHADVPLEKTGGALVADLVVEQRLTCVLDVSELSEGDKTRFLIDFAERLYRQNTEPLHLFLEEADDFCPQRPFREQARLVRAWENVVRRGRQRGLGITMITQRSAALNKNVLTQIETLFVLRTTSPQDRKAIAGWVEYHGQSKELLESLPSLESGEAWVWSPSWLKKLERVRIRQRRTFDSGATPKGGDAKRPGTLADVDLAAVTKAMAATIERAKAEDPRELRKKIAELNAEIAKKNAVVDRRTAKIDAKLARVRTVPALKARDRQDLDRAIARLEKLSEDWRSGVYFIEKIQAAAADLREALTLPPPPAPGFFPRPSFQPPTVRTSSGEPGVPVLVRPEAPTAAKPRPTSSDVGRGGLYRILVALAQRNGLTRRQLGLRAGLSSRSGTFANYLARGRTAGWIEGSDVLTLTAHGLAALGDFKPLPEGEALLRYWLDDLGEESGAARILGSLAQAYPRALSRAEIGKAANLSPESGTFANYLSRLRGLELINGSSEIRASEEFFS